MVGFFDGANCCWLEEGHEGDHMNHFGQTYPNKRWGTSAEVHEYIASLYSMPGRRRR